VSGSATDHLKGGEGIAGSNVDKYVYTEEIHIVAFLCSLTGEMPKDFMVLPALPLGVGEGDFGPELSPSTEN